MAGIVQFPGATIEMGKVIRLDEPIQSESASGVIVRRPRTATVECTFTIHSPAKLLWWATRTHYIVRWWQWLFVVFTVVKVAILHQLGQWRWFEDED